LEKQKDNSTCDCNDDSGDNCTCSDTQKEVLDTAREEKVGELEILSQALGEEKKKTNELSDQLLRLKAEFENFRKRNEKERQNLIAWGKEDILLKQLDLLFVIEQACKSVDGASDLESIKTGLKLIHSEFKRMLKAEGVSIIDALGKQFDLNLHDAVEQVENDNVQDGSILEVLQDGYKIGNKVIKHAKVKVAKNNKKIEKGEYNG